MTVNLRSDLRLLYEPELDIINEAAAALLGDNTTSLLGTRGGELPKCEWVALKSERETAYLFRGETDASQYSMLSASGITQSDDGVGECLRVKQAGSPPLEPALGIDRAAIIVSQAGTSVPWHVEDNCR